ncbi:hypothetical protein CCM_03099 [Cordyceps militaris CM01]|uniref:Uncharacterized protein n=1 Tax=Cordyceps militaris (strain CM01) TaxID=983644 RepID=G3J8U5_CORMM|nr:uncharacterized protein CCM_03099 [Cordyceps militaris CM01]EGX94828.1 hypothetical protein CCM_03099 [Cordyceps militaris CM01]
MQRVHVPQSTPTTTATVPQSADTAVTALLQDLGEKRVTTSLLTSLPLLYHP